MIRKMIFPSLACLTMSILLISGCATSTSHQQPQVSAGQASIQALTVTSLQGGATVLEIVSDKSAPYTAFKLIDPPRVVVDFQGKPDPNLRAAREVNDGNVSTVRVEAGPPEDSKTRVIVGLSGPVDYDVTDQDHIITLRINPRTILLQPESQAVLTVNEKGAEPVEKEVAAVPAVKPRIFFEPKPMDLNQVLGVDFNMLEHGKSRLTITTDRKAPFRLERKEAKTLLMTIEESTIPPLLMRRLDSSHFEGAVDRVKASLVGDQVSLLISLRDMVPFHSDQMENEITIDFGRTSIKPPDKQIVPVRVVEAKEPTITISPLSYKEIPEESKSTRIPGISGRKYTGAPMTMDFVNADVTNILRLIGEVSNLNIIWGPEVTGKVSMRLKNVPWDQALDLVLANNDLGKRREGNVIWVATSAKLRQIEEEEKRKRDEADAERKRKLEALKEKEQLVPLVTEYFPLDFASPEAIKGHIQLSERGSISIDARSNTIIMKDTAANIEEARKIVARFDEPVKQIMIEARIVDAGTDFTRDLGVQWNNLQLQYRSNQNVPLGLPADAENLDPNQGSLGGGSFSSFNPLGWVPNIGLSFARLTNNIALTLDADLALAETEGTVKIISAPKVLASNGEEAFISRGDIIYRDIVTADRIDTKELQATLSLTVTPTVSYNDFVTMAIEVTDDRAPTDDRKQEKKITTKLMIKNGETVVIGGIFKETKTEAVDRIPWLGKVPILGWLFKAERKTSERTELLIFLTPRVVNTGGKEV